MQNVTPRHTRQEVPDTFGKFMCKKTSSYSRNSFILIRHDLKWRTSWSLYYVTWVNEEATIYLWNEPTQNGTLPVLRIANCSCWVEAHAVTQWNNRIDTETSTPDGGNSRWKAKQPPISFFFPYKHWAREPTNYRAFQALQPLKKEHFLLGKSPIMKMLWSWTISHIIELSCCSLWAALRQRLLQGRYGCDGALKSGSRKKVCRVQGDPSGCSICLVDTKTKVTFHYMLLILHTIFALMATTPREQPEWSGHSLHRFEDLHGGWKQHHLFYRRCPTWMHGCLMH